MTGKAKNMPQRSTFLGRGQWSEGHGPTLEKVKLFEMSFPYFKIYFMQIGHLQSTLTL